MMIQTCTGAHIQSVPTTYHEHNLMTRIINSRMDNENNYNNRQRIIGVFIAFVAYFLCLTFLSSFLNVSFHRKFYLHVVGPPATYR